MFTAAAASPCTVHTRRRAITAGEGVRKAGGQGTRPGTSRAPGHNHPTTSPQASKLSYTDLSKLSKKAAASPCTVYIHEGNTKAGNSCGRRWLGSKGRAPGHTGRALAGHRGTNAQSSNQHFAKSIVHRSFSRIRPYIINNIILRHRPSFCIILLGRTVFAPDYRLTLLILLAPYRSRAQLLRRTQDA